MSDIKLKVIDSIKNSGSNIVVAACFLSGVAFFDYMLFVPVIMFLIVGLAIVKWKSPLICLVGLIIGIVCFYLLSSDLTQLGLTKLLLISWVCISSGLSLIKSLLLNR